MTQGIGTLASRVRHFLTHRTHDTHVNSLLSRAFRCVTVWVGLYAALLGIWLIVLSLRVIALRGNPAFKWFGFGNLGDVSLQRAIRGHGNLIEYAPIFLILLYFVETSGFSVTAIHWYGSVFVLGRLMHGVCFGFLEKNMFLRVAGTVLTLFPILGLSVVLLLRFI